jgi:hypothetical protein
MATRYLQCANRAQLQREAQPRADRLSAPDNPHWDTKNHRKRQTDAKEHITSQFNEVINTSYTTREGTKGCRKHSQDVQGLGDMQWHATSQQTDEEEEDEVREYIIKPLIRKLQEMGLKPGYTEEMWMDCLGHLASPSVYKGDGTMNSRLWRSEPPQGYGTQFWGAFINVISKDVKDTIRAACRMPEEKEQTSLFVEEYKEPEQNVTRTFIECWDGNGAWQTIHQQMHTFVEGLTSNKTRGLIEEETTTSLGISMERQG